MKRYGDLYRQITDYENLKLAHRNAQKGKKHYPEVVKVNAREDAYLTALQRQLQNKTFVNSDYKTFIKQGAKKDRTIYKLPYYPDRIVHHAIMNVCEPIWQRSLIRDTYAALKGRGIHDGVRRFKTFLQDRKNTKYCFKFDIKKFYPSIDNDILFEQILPKKIKCKDTLWLLGQIAYSTEGLPIGNYLSQIWGNLYLSPFDWFVKQDKQIKYYSRYCDDLVILSDSKNFLHNLKDECTAWLNDNLNLQVKENWQIFPRFNRPIDYLGYVFCDGYTLVRKDIVKKFKQKILNIKKKWASLSHSRIINTIMSYYGWFYHANTWNLWNTYIDKEMKNIVAYVCWLNNTKNPLRRIYA